MKNYTIIKSVGKGSFSEVFKVKNQNGDILALKRINTENSQFLRYIETEIKIARQKLKHKNIVQILSAVDNEVGNLHFVMEFCELGNLNDYMLKETTDLCQRTSFMLDMALGVNYLHGQNIIHRDLKPENVVLTKQNEQIICKITDFGVSKFKLSKFDKCATLIGTAPYMAPEITGYNEYSNEVDVFALGLLFFVVYKESILKPCFGGRSLIPGFYKEGDRIAYLNVELKRTNPSKEEFIKDFFADAKNVGEFIFSMLAKEPKERPEMDTVLIKMAEMKAHTNIQKGQGDQTPLVTENANLLSQVASLLNEKEDLDKKVNSVKTERDNFKAQVQSLELIQREVS